MSDQPVDEKKDSKISIEVNGQTFLVNPGQTVLAALLSNKLRPQAKKSKTQVGLCGAGYCYACAVTLNGVPNIRSCMTPVRAGMEIEI